jgi:hypothetical protein
VTFDKHHNKNLDSSFPETIKEIVKCEKRWVGTHLNIQSERWFDPSAISWLGLSRRERGHRNRWNLWSSPYLTDQINTASRKPKQTHLRTIIKGEDVDELSLSRSDVVQQNASVIATSRNELPPDHLLLDRSPYIGPLISRWKLHKFKKFLKQKLYNL